MRKAPISAVLAVFLGASAQGLFGGERAFLKCGGATPARFVFSGAKGERFALPGVKERFAALPPEVRPREFYVKCRAVRLAGSVSWCVSAAGNVSWRLPFSKMGRIETFRMRPEIISNRKATGYDHRQLRDFQLVGSGSGEIEIFEFGTTDDGLTLVRRWGDFLLRNWSRKPIPAGTKRFATIDLSNFGKIALDAEMDLAAKEIGGIPVKLETESGRVAAVEATKDGVRIPVGRKAASLCFLQASTVGDTTFDRTNYADEMKGPLTAAYEVEYADGTREMIEIRFGWNSLEWLSPSTTFDTFQRYPTDSRAIWTGKLSPAALQKARRIKWKQLFAPDTAVANLWEWVNPHPEKEIVALVLKRKFTDVRYALIALTARDVASTSSLK